MLYYRLGLWILWCGRGINGNLKNFRQTILLLGSSSTRNWMAEISYEFRTAGLSATQNVVRNLGSNSPLAEHTPSTPPHVG